MRRLLAICVCVKAFVPPTRRRSTSLQICGEPSTPHKQRYTTLRRRCESLQALPTTLQAASDVSGLDAERAIDALGRDIFAFLAASVLVVPASRLVGAPPVLGFLAIGCILGPHGLGVFGDVEADVALETSAFCSYCSTRA